MKTLTIIGFLFFFVSLSQSNFFGQTEPEDSTKVSWDWYHIVKHNGVEYIAQIISDDGREVLIYTKELGKVYIPKSEIKSMKKIDNPSDVVFGEYRDVGPFTTRYQFTTNALPIKKGENYALLNLYGPEVHFAVTNSTSVGVMASWIGSPIALAAKQTFKTSDPKWNLSIGTITGTTGYINSFRGFGGLHFGNVTYGNRNNNITFAAGIAHFKSGNTDFYYDETYVEYDATMPYPYNNLTGSFRKTPTRVAGMFALSGIAKVGAKASFICDIIVAVSKPEVNLMESGQLSQDYYDPNTGTWTYGKQYLRVSNVREQRAYFIFMPGMRFQKSPREAFQFALAGVTFKMEGDTYTFPIPMCSWFYKF